MLFHRNITLWVQKQGTSITINKTQLVTMIILIYQQVYLFLQSRVSHMIHNQTMAESTLKLINDMRYKIFGNVIFEMKQCYLIWS